MYYEKIKKSDKALTHAGTFHADDVFSAALLKEINPNIKIERVYKIPKDYNGIVFDIGGGRYDHHGEQEYRENGIPYASFGKIWRDVGAQIIGNKERAMELDSRFIEDIDYADNGGDFNILSTTISSFNPNWDEKDVNEDERFNDAVDFASVVLKNEIKKEKSVDRAFKKFDEIKEEKENVLILDEYLPPVVWNEYCEKNEIKFAMYPDKRNENAFVLRKIDLDNDIFDVYTKTFPTDWLGKNQDELEKIDDRVLFCHHSDFMAVCKSKEQAIDVANEIVEIKTIIKNINDIENNIGISYKENHISLNAEITNLKDANKAIVDTLSREAEKILEKEPYKEIRARDKENNDYEISVKCREEHKNQIQYKINDREVSKEKFWEEVDKKEISKEMEKESRNVDRESMKMVEEYEKITGEELDNVNTFAMSFWNALDNAETIEEFEEIEHLASARMSDFKSRHASKGYKNIGKVVAKENNAFIKNVFEQVKECSDREVGERAEGVVSYDEADTLDYIERGYSREMIESKENERKEIDEIDELYYESYKNQEAIEEHDDYEENYYGERTLF